MPTGSPSYHIQLHLASFPSAIHLACVLVGGSAISVVRPYAGIRDPGRDLLGALRMAWHAACHVLSSSNQEYPLGKGWADLCVMQSSGDWLWTSLLASISVSGSVSASM